MDYPDYLNQYCPAAIHQTVNALTAGAASTDENLAFNKITSANLSRDCLIGITGQLGNSLSRTSTSDFKARYLDLVTYYFDQLKRVEATEFTVLRQTIGDGIVRIIDDVSEPRLAGPMLAVLGKLRINLLSQIEKRVTYREVSVLPPLREWVFVEYAFCLRHPGASKQTAQLFARIDAQTLRNIFVLTHGKLHSESYCTDTATLRSLVRPHLDDKRLTADVNGPGSAVSVYARQLFEAL